MRPGIPALYKSSFKGSTMRSSLRLEALAGEASHAVELNNPTTHPEPACSFKNELLKQRGQKIVGRSPASSESLDPHRGLAALKAVELAPDEPASVLLRELSAFAIYAPNTNALRGLVPDPQSREPVGLAGGRLPEAVLELMASRRKDPRLQSVSDSILEMIDWVESFRSRSVSDDIPLSPSVASARQVIYFKDRFMAESRNGLTGYDASEGALYVLFAAILATMPSAPPILAIDNVDHGLHPRLARALVEKMCEWTLASVSNKQILLTTHNPLVLDGLPLENDDIRLFAVGRSRKGRTTVNRVRLELADLQRDGELWTVSRLWVMGISEACPMYRVALVCEGPTDRAIITAILDVYLEDYECVSIQPPRVAIGGDAGPLGGGWKGVRTWCQQEASVSNQIVNVSADLLIVQLDADVSGDPSIDQQARWSARVLHRVPR